MQIIFSNTIITNINSTKFHGLIIDSSLSWKDHTTELTSKLNKACYGNTAKKTIYVLDVMKMTYYSMSTQLYHMVLFFGVVFTSVAAFLKLKKEK
jgi:hypothetical protein